MTLRLITLAELLQGGPSSQKETLHISVVAAEGLGVSDFVYRISHYYRPLFGLPFVVGSPNHYYIYPPCVLDYQRGPDVANEALMHKVTVVNR